jgi:ribosomal protein S18 acetylase RimI-like enzyme
MNIRLTPAAPTDSEAITRLYREVWLATYLSKEHGISREDIEEFLNPSITPEAIDGHKKWLADLPKNIRVTVAKDGAVLVGFSYVKLGDSESNNKLRALYVNPSCQGKGIGTLLWNDIIPHLNPDKDTDVEVIAYNQRAFEFYKRLGFLDEGVRVTDNKDFQLQNGAILPLAYLRRPKTV